MRLQRQWNSDMMRFWLKLALASSILWSLSIGLLMVFGKRLPIGAWMAYTVATPTRERIAVIDTDHHLKALLSSAYLPYQNFYGWDSQGNFAFLSDRDGNTEVYIWDGATYTNISQHPFNDWRPAMNHDGRVAFASERDGNMEIYVWNRGQLANVSESPGADDYPAWSDDGRLAWVTDRDGENEIYVWDGVNARNASNDPTGADSFPVWSPDGRLAWVTRTSSMYQIQVWDGEHIVDVADYSEFSHLAWSDDGKLAYDWQNDVYVWDGKQRINVSNDPAQDFGPAWSPDGRLIFARTLLSGSDFYVWDGTSVKPLPNDTPTGYFPVWTPR
jgi:Tol biopolymer transport system component